MKVAVCLSACFVLAVAVKLSPEKSERLVRADVLRDFPGLCYASTQCRSFAEGEEWNLKPFCGMSKCVVKDGQLMEMVKDCGLPVKKNDKCQMIQNITLGYPDCCPTFDCEAGVKLEFIDLTAPSTPTDKAAGKP